MTELHFTKGQGTGNDFVLFADPDATVDLTPERIRAIADRRFGVGGDGVIRAVRSEAIPEGRALVAVEPEATWFMDYHNADGTVAEMCGNGIRVFARYLTESGLVELAPGETLTVGSRKGLSTSSAPRTGSPPISVAGAWASRAVAPTTCSSGPRTSTGRGPASASTWATRTWSSPSRPRTNWPTST